MTILMIGCDPGMTGYLALLDKDARLLDTAKMPLKPKDPKRKSNRVDPHGLGMIVQNWRKAYAGAPCYACIEDLQFMQGDKMGAFSLMNMGSAAGIAEGVLTIMCRGVMMVPPAKWKRDLRLSKDKAASVELAHRLFNKNMGHDRAEAALIGYYGLSQGMGR